jgi:hypothetical protein
MALAEINIIPADGIPNDKKVFVRIGGNPQMITAKEAKGLVKNLCIQFGWNCDYGKDNG